MSLTLGAVGLVGLPTNASPTSCPNQFYRESTSVFSSAHRGRLTAGQVRDGKVCLKVVKPTSSDCGFYNSEGVYVLSGAAMGRLTGNGTKIRAGRVCLGIQRPGSRVWDPVSKNPASFTIRTQNASEHRTSNGYRNPYRTISNTTEVGCRGQCTIRARCKEYDYKTTTKECRLWTQAGGRPIYDPNMKAGLKSPKTAIKHMPQPQAARQFATMTSSGSQGATHFKLQHVPSWEVCARACINAKATTSHGRCIAASMGPQNGLKICRLYAGGTRKAISVPSSRRNEFLYGRKVGKSRDR